MSESEVKNDVQENNIAALFDALRKFEVTLDTGEIRKAEIRIPTSNEQRCADEYVLSVIKEKSEGEPDPITGKIIKLPLRENMIEYAKEKGMWTETDETEYDRLQKTLRAKIDQLARGKMKLSRGYDLAMQIMQDRKELFPYNQRRWEIHGLTADAAGEEAMHRYLYVATAVWEDGERIFPDIKAFEKASNAKGSLKNLVMASYMTVVRAANAYVASGNVETEFFRNYGFLDKDNNLYDVSKKNVVMNLRESDEQEEQTEILTGFTDDSGNVVDMSVHPSFSVADDTKQAGG